MEQNPSQETKTFVTEVKIRFRDADPAGIMFFGNILGLSHDLFEEFLEHNGIPWKEWFKSTDWACPIRHSEVDYLSPFFPGTTVSVTVTVARLGQSSFTMSYVYQNLQSHKVHAKAKITHSFAKIHGNKLEKEPIPTKYRLLLERFLKEPSA